MAEIRVEDWTNSQPNAPAFVLDLADGVPVTARFLIEERVRLEWDRLADAGVEDRPERGRPLIARPNGSLRPPDAPQSPRTVDEAIGLAHRGFAENAFLLLVDGAQVTEIDAAITLKADSTVTFLRLTPLAGG